MLEWLASQLFNELSRFVLHNWKSPDAIYIQTADLYFLLYEAAHEGKDARIKDTGTGLTGPQVFFMDIKVLCCELEDIDAKGIGRNNILI